MNLRDTSKTIESRSKFSSLLFIAIGIWMVGYSIAFCVETRNWPLVSDAVLMRYTSFLMDHGRTLYRDILDPNMPGTFFFDWLETHTLGTSALASRIYDLLLLGFAAGAMLIIAWRRSRFAAVYAASLLVLFHGRDGILQISQRDLLMAAGLMWAIAFATLLTRNYRPVWAFLFGLTIGLITTVKPFACLSLLLLIVLMPALHHIRRVKVLLPVLAGFLIPVLALFFYLYTHKIIKPFLFVIFTIDPLHAHLGFPGLAFLIRWSVTPSLVVISLLGFAAMLTAPSTDDNFERKILLLGAAIGLFGYFIQFKGYAYHRYPYVACLLLFASLELTNAAKRSGKIRLLGTLGLLYGAILAPLYLRHAIRLRWPNQMEVALRHDLSGLGDNVLNGNIQCIDSISGCSRFLYDMRLVQSTGMVYDEYLFLRNPSAGVAEQREDFLRALETKEPKFIVVTPDMFPAGPGGYQKLLLWPAFDLFLSHCYDEVADRSFPRGAPIEHGYRLYKLTAKCHG